MVIDWFMKENVFYEFYNYVYEYSNVVSFENIFKIFIFRIFFILLLYD